MGGCPQSAWGLRPSELLAGLVFSEGGHREQLSASVHSCGLDGWAVWPGVSPELASHPHPHPHPHPPQVLIPVFALGRAQELCILLETFW